MLDPTAGNMRAAFLPDSRLAVVRPVAPNVECVDMQLTTLLSR
jgi:hypothetical protein